MWTVLYMQIEPEWFHSGSICIYLPKNLAWCFQGYVQLIQDTLLFQQLGWLQVVSLETLCVFFKLYCNVLYLAHEHEDTASPSYRLPTSFYRSQLIGLWLENFVNLSALLGQGKIKPTPFGYIHPENLCLCLFSHPWCLIPLRHIYKAGVDNMLIHFFLCKTLFGELWFSVFHQLSQLVNKPCQ